MIVNTLKMCTGDAGPEQSLVLFSLSFPLPILLKKSIIMQNLIKIFGAVQEL